MSFTYFVIVGTNDAPIFEMETKSDNSVFKNPISDYLRCLQKEENHLNQFMVHSALDLVDDIMWTTNNSYLKVVDKFNQWSISAYITSGGLSFLQSRSDY